MIALVGICWCWIHGAPFEAIARTNRGAVIDGAERPNTAVLLLDMQKDFLRDTKARQWGSAYRADRIAVMTELAKDATGKGQSVVAVKQVYEGAHTNFLIGLLGEGLGTKGSTGLELDSRLAFAPDSTVTKQVGDTFTSAEFLQYLEMHRIGTLRITGLDGYSCVKSTVLSALGRGYGVELVEDAMLSISQESWKTCRTELEGKGAHLVQAAQLEGDL